MLERTSWILLALIHLTPFAVFFAPTTISRLYSVAQDDPSFALLHHRAALFGVVFIASACGRHMILVSVNWQSFWQLFRCSAF